MLPPWSRVALRPWARLVFFIVLAWVAARLAGDTQLGPALFASALAGWAAPQLVDLSGAASEREGEVMAYAAVGAAATACVLSVAGADIAVWGIAALGLGVFLIVIACRPDSVRRRLVV